MNISDPAFEQFRGNPPVTADDIRQFEVVSGMRLRQDYTVFLMKRNGGEGFVGHSYATLWRLQELIERNKEYRVSVYAPGLFLFGSDGGDDAFAFDMRTVEQPIVRIPFIPLTLKEVIPLADDFEGFIRKLSSSNES